MTTSEDQASPDEQQRPDDTSASATEAAKAGEEGATLGLTGEPNTFEPEEEAGPEPSDGPAT